MARNTTKQPKPREIDVDIHEVSKLFQSEFDDDFLERCLNKARVRPTDKPELPPKIMTVGESVLASFGNFSASTGKAKSKKTFNISAMVAAALTNRTVLNYTASLHWCIHRIPCILRVSNLITNSTGQTSIYINKTKSKNDS